MQRLRNIFLQGLAAVLPISVTLALLYWLATTAERFLSPAIHLLLPDRYYLPGLGILCGIGLIFLLGLLLNAFVIRALFDWTERTIARIPLIKGLYSGVRDLFGLFAAGNNRAIEEEQVVALELNGARMIGLVTARDIRLPRRDRPADELLVAVYLPFGYQIGGHTLFLPRERLEPLDMGVEEAMRLVLTGGIGATGHSSR